VKLISRTYFELDGFWKIPPAPGEGGILEDVMWRKILKGRRKKRKI
jgi:hypothetical protein